MNSIHPCWCGQKELSEFSPDYLICPNCRTLVLKTWPAVEQFEVRDDANDFYGRNYYESHLSQDYGYPGLAERSREDLIERCLHWIRVVLKYRLPPARTLELGCGHGGFVALMRWAGFDASGLELSPWLVRYAKSVFGVPMFEGQVEDQKIEPHSLDLILLFDVLEHLPDPISTTRHCIELLKPDGTLIIQTPCFPADRVYQEIVQTKDRFLEQLKPAEHLYLFNRDSIQRFFSLAGAPFVNFEPAAFDYDMFVVAGPGQPVFHSAEEGKETLLGQPQGRMVQALLDADARYRDLTQRCQEIDADREVRLRALEEADARIKEIEADRKCRLQALEKADAWIKQIETDREARLKKLLEMDAFYKKLKQSYDDLREKLASQTSIDRSNAGK